MSMSGGYRVIDLANKPLSNFATVYPGIYDYIEASNKLCVVSGLYAGGVEYDDVAVLFTGGTTLNAKITDSLELVVTDEDKVTVVVTEPAESMKSIDFTGVAISSGSGTVSGNRNKFLELVNLIAKGSPFYFKGLNLSDVLDDSQFKSVMAVAVSSNNTDTCTILVVDPGGVLYVVGVICDTTQFSINFIKSDYNP